MDAIVAKAGEAPRTVDDILNEANALLTSITNGSASGSATSSPPADGVICDEFGCTVRLPTTSGAGGSTSPLARSLAGDGWSIEIASNASALFPAGISGPNWTINLTQEELKDVLEAVLSARNVVKNLHDQGDWHASLQSSAQWRVNTVLARATYPVAAADEAAFDLAIMMDPKGKRPVRGQWPAAVVASMLAALDRELNPALVHSAVVASTA